MGLLDVLRQTGRFKTSLDHKCTKVHTDAHILKRTWKKLMFGSECVTAYIFSCTFLWEHFRTQVWKIPLLYVAHCITAMISALGWILY